MFTNAYQWITKWGQWVKMSMSVSSEGATLRLTITLIQDLATPAQRHWHRLGFWDKTDTRSAWSVCGLVAPTSLGASCRRRGGLSLSQALELLVPWNRLIHVLLLCTCGLCWGANTFITKSQSLTSPHWT